MKTLADLFTQYSESHQNALNKKIHLFAVPAIYLSFLSLLNEITLPWQLIDRPITLMVPVLLLFLGWYFFYSIVIGLYMLLLSIIGLTVFYLIEILSHDVVTNANLYLCSVIFLIAWLAQFYGHKVEGRKPSFFEDIFFLLVGPAWVSVPVLNKLGIKLDKVKSE